MTIKEVIDMAEIYAGLAGQDFGAVLNPKLKLQIFSALISELFDGTPYIDDIIDLNSGESGEIELPYDVSSIDRVYAIDGDSAVEILKIDANDVEALK